MRGKRAKYLRNMARAAAPDAPDAQYVRTRFKKVVRVKGSKSVLMDAVHIKLAHCHRLLYQNLKKAWYN
jgi:hypothetical protein